MCYGKNPDGNSQLRVLTFEVGSQPNNSRRNGKIFLYEIFYTTDPSTLKTKKRYWLPALELLLIYLSNYFRRAASAKINCIRIRNKVLTK